MKISFALASATLAAAMPQPTYPAHTTHHLRTMTDGEGQTVLIDEANANLGVFIAGYDGIDGIYDKHYEEPASGTMTWVDIHDGVHAVIDLAHPNHYTVYNSAGSPIETESYPLSSAPYQTEVTHHLRTFTNQNCQTVLIDYAVTDAAVIEIGKVGVDGIYYADEARPHSGTDTWVNDYDGVVAVIDNEHPNYFTVYDTAHNPIETISYPLPTRTYY
ncbi:hypothetical protein FBU59_005460 [Linderina macrospora]|uniref:Uncharacterized protein n=1 Tax=Linderina macrospora TaxID=4868 RepID=A0ACC1J2Q4_9FUNG|nr:hypothetical protein FBU59_005460 [Linderina macrospora]